MLAAMHGEQPKKPRTKSASVAEAIKGSGSHTEAMRTRHGKKRAHAGEAWSPCIKQGPTSNGIEPDLPYRLAPLLHVSLAKNTGRLMRDR